MAKIGSVVFDHIADEHILPQPIYCQNNIMFILLTAATCNADNPLLSWWTPEKPAFRRCSIAAASPVQAARCRGSLGAGICLYGYRVKLNSVRFRYIIFHLILKYMYLLQIKVVMLVSFREVISFFNFSNEIKRPSTCVISNTIHQDQHFRQEILVENKAVLILTSMALKYLLPRCWVIAHFFHKSLLFSD